MDEFYSLFQYRGNFDKQQERNMFGWTRVDSYLIEVGVEVIGGEVGTGESVVD